MSKVTQPDSSRARTQTQSVPRASVTEQYKPSSQPPNPTPTLSVPVTCLHLNHRKRCLGNTSSNSFMLQKRKQRWKGDVLFHSHQGSEPGLEPPSPGSSSSAAPGPLSYCSSAHTRVPACVCMCPCVLHTCVCRDHATVGRVAKKAPG